MDFITDLPPLVDPKLNQAYNLILVIIDHYTKVVKYIPTWKTLDTPSLA